MGKRIVALTVCISMVVAWTNASLSQESTKQDTLRELMRRIDILTEELEKAKLGEVADDTYESVYGMGPAASKVYRVKSTGASIGGYGEVIYQNFSSENDGGTPSGATNQIDALRVVVYLGFRFTDWLLFNSEIEFEHAKAGDGQPGEVAVEFAFVEARLHQAISLRAGMLLMPVGIINELHEPTTFHGVLRPDTERNIIPTTWRGNGAGFVGETQGGIGYKLYLAESLYARGFSSGGVRSGRQNGAEALAEDLGLTGRLNYRGVSGLDIGGSFFIGNTAQDLANASGDPLGARLTLWSLHALFARKGLELRGLFAQSSIDEAAELNDALGLAGSSSVGDKQQGYYLTVAYDVFPLLAPGTTHYLAPFVQFEKVNTQESVPGGFSINPALERTNLTFGLTYKPYPNVAFKADYINRDNEANTAVDQFNLAVNFMF